MLIDFFIYTENLTKTDGTVKAINNLDLEVHAREIFGFLGPNGAGKNTTFRVLTTLTRPTSGFVSVGDFDVRKEPDKVKQVMGELSSNI
ncbi:MAG TPA: ATP-binding cassette domain-containing protein [Candidatus Limnocylindrales bacterium]|nr:ATP-binding cassette domain-containing protein [Candidatus Limnocylindrales bacterium]